MAEIAGYVATKWDSTTNPVADIRQQNEKKGKFLFYFCPNLL